jgi:hypothetical protein
MLVVVGLMWQLELKQYIANLCRPKNSHILHAIVKEKS